MLVQKKNLRKHIIYLLRFYRGEKRAIAKETCSNSFILQCKKLKPKEENGLIIECSEVLNGSYIKKWEILMSPVLLVHTISECHWFLYFIYISEFG